MRLASLKRNEDFQKVFKNGRSAGGGFLFIKFLKNNLGYLRLGITVSSKTSKKATIRNTIKRKIREAIRQKEKYKKIPFDLVVIATPAIVDKNHKEIKGKIDQTMDRILSQLKQ